MKYLSKVTVFFLVVLSSFSTTMSKSSAHRTKKQPHNPQRLRHILLDPQQQFSIEQSLENFRPAFYPSQRRFGVTFGVLKEQVSVLRTLDIFQQTILNIINDFEIRKNQLIDKFEEIEKKREEYFDDLKIKKEDSKKLNDEYTDRIHSPIQQILCNTLKDMLDWDEKEEINIKIEDMPKKREQVFDDFENEEGDVEKLNNEYKPEIYCPIQKDLFDTIQEPLYNDLKYVLDFIEKEKKIDQNKENDQENFLKECIIDIEKYLNKTINEEDIKEIFNLFSYHRNLVLEYGETDLKSMREKLYDAVNEIQETKLGECLDHDTIEQVITSENFDDDWKYASLDFISFHIDTLKSWGELEIYEYFAFSRESIENFLKENKKLLLENFEMAKERFLKTAYLYIFKKYFNFTKN